MEDSIGNILGTAVTQVVTESFDTYSLTVTDSCRNSNTEGNYGNKILQNHILFLRILSLEPQIISLDATNSYGLGP
jgi:hypothetical protein